MSSRDKLIKTVHKIIEYAPMYTSTWEASIFADARKLATNIHRIMQEDWQAMNDPRLQARLLASYMVKLDELLERWLDIETQRRQGNLEDMPSSPSRRSFRGRFDPAFLRSGPASDRVLYPEPPEPPHPEPEPEMEEMPELH